MKIGRLSQEVKGNSEQKTWGRCHAFYILLLCQEPTSFWNVGRWPDHSTSGFVWTVLQSFLRLITRLHTKIHECCVWQWHHHDIKACTQCEAHPSSMYHSLILVFFPPHSRDCLKPHNCQHLIYHEIKQSTEFERPEQHSKLLMMHRLLSAPFLYLQTIVPPI